MVTKQPQNVDLSRYTELCTSRDQVKRINIAMFINLYRIQLTFPNSNYEH